MVIPAGRIIEVNTLTAEARSITVQGTLRAGRTAASRLTLYGNLVVQGVLDYGRPDDRVPVPATIRWFLDESLYVGGDAHEPVATDVGLWGIENAQIWIHGVYRDAWSPLAQTAAAGATEILVSPAYSQGWQVGDLLAIAATRTGYGVREERRRIAAVLGGGRFRLDAALQQAHEVLTTNWRDAWGDTWTEVMAGKVANLTSNVQFEAGDPNQRPHVMLMDATKAYVEDLAVVNFSPAPKFAGYDQRTDIVLPFGRYAWHFHQQDGNSRGSYLRRVRIYDGIGDGLHVHESWGVEVTDVVVVNQARTSIRVTGGLQRAAAPIFLERSVSIRYRTPQGYNDPQGHACDDGWVDRALVMGAGGFDERSWGHGIWLAASVNCTVVGFTGAGGNLSSGMHWMEGAGQREIVHAYRAESFGNGYGFFSWHNRSFENSSLERIVDLLAWRNVTGLAWGAYITSYWGHQIRSLGNEVQLTHWAMGWSLTGFLADGLGVPNSRGIQIGRYATASTTDTVYEDGVVRNVTENLRHEESPDVGRASWVQFVRVAWASARRVLFDGSGVPPVGSLVRFRQQSGLSRPANFTLFHRNDSAAPSGNVLDTEYNARRLDNDTAGTRPQTPRVRLSAPSDDAVASGSITLVAESSGTSVRFYLANRVLATVPVVSGRATYTFNMSAHPYRRAYFWALATGQNGATNASRVIRVNRF